MDKKTVRLTESDLHRIIKESVRNILREGKKKDPMQQWFKDMDDAQKHRDNMDYVNKGGRRPKHWKTENVDESGDTRRGAYMKGRALGRRLSNVDTSTMADHDMSNPYTEIGMKDQYDYEKSSDGNKEERMDAIKDRFSRLKHHDKFFDDWQRHIDGKQNESISRIVKESINDVLNELERKTTRGTEDQ